MNNEEKCEKRAEARGYLRDAAALLREIGDTPESAIESLLRGWQWDEPDERIDEHFYEQLAAKYDPPVHEPEPEDEEEE